MYYPGIRESISNPRMDTMCLNDILPVADGLGAVLRHGTNAAAQQGQQHHDGEQYTADKEHVVADGICP